MILVDTSAWIEYLRATGSLVHGEVRRLIESEADLATTDPIWLEYYQPRGRPEVETAVQEASARDRVAIVAMVLVEVLRTAPTQESYETLKQDPAALRWPGNGPERLGKRVPATDPLIAGTPLEQRLRMAVRSTCVIIWFIAM